MQTSEHPLLTGKRFRIQGTVQGVGFRPFVYRIAHEVGIMGSVSNDAQGVTIIAYGREESLEAFSKKLEKERPPVVTEFHLQAEPIDALRDTIDDFKIIPSKEGDLIKPSIPSDIAICPACREELLSPSNRRYRYPFINCTHCGPRFSILESLPYDRKATSMKSFVQCDDCEEEFTDPLNRRFHAQPNACHKCGPQLAFWDSKGQCLARREDALQKAITSLKQGNIVAVKGLGGFHLMVDAGNEKAVQRLRDRKHREEKPLALMLKDIDAAMALCEISNQEKALLESPAAPIVLLKKNENITIPENIAPNNPYLGIMLPYTALHVLLTEATGTLVATSGNLSEEPICIDETEALHRLNNIADAYLVHDRPIVRSLDDSIVRVVAGQPLMLRRSRGYAPRPIAISEKTDHSILAVGAHLKNTTAVTVESDVILSQHIGDLTNATALEAFDNSVNLLLDLFYKDRKLDAVVCDMHPDYTSTTYATKLNAPQQAVQHHHAHVLAAIAEHHISEPVLGVVWDGTGYGTDGTIWGGEFLGVAGNEMKRLAHLRTFRLPGGEQAIKEPKRSAFALLYELFGKYVEHHPIVYDVLKFCPNEVPLLLQMLERNLNCPTTSSAGRLFDAIAAIVGLGRATYEGQVAMNLEFSIDSRENRQNTAYRFDINESAGKQILDWEPVIIDVLQNVKAGISPSIISLRFHNALVNAIAETAQRFDYKKIVLTGGCFQNKYLLEHCIEALRNAGLTPIWPQQVPPNDGGIALGQTMAALLNLQSK